MHPLGGASTHFIQTFKKTSFSAKKYGKICQKNAYFLEKSL